MLPLLLWIGALAGSTQLDHSGRRWLAEDFELSVWDVQRGLPQRSARSITQTPDGVIWIGTFDGLARLSSRGVTVVRGPVPGADTDNAFVSLLTDRAGRLWAGTANDILCLEQETWRAYGAEDGCAQGVVYDLAEDAEGRIVASTAVGLLRLDDGRFEPLPLPPEFAANPEHPRIELDRTGRLWVQGRRALAYLEHDRWTVVASHGAPDAYLALAPARSGGVWVRIDRTLVRHDGRGAQEVHELPPDLEPGDASLCEDPSGNLWVGTFESGLARRSRSGHWSVAREEQGLPNALVPTLFLDGDGNLWAGTSGAGAVRISDPRFRRLHDASQYVDDNVVTALCRATDGVLYFATHSGGLHRIEGQLPREIAAGSGKEVITALTAAPDGGLWIGTDSNGLWRFEHGVARSQRAVPRDFGPITALQGDAEGRLWLAGTDRLGLLDGDTLVLQELPETRIFGLARAASGDVWAATSRGALCSTAEGRFELRAEIAGERSVHSVLADDARRLWFTLDGPELLRLENGVRHSFGPTADFALEEGRLLFSDAIGIWLVGRDRLLRFPHAPECHVPLAFDRSDGLVLGLDRTNGLLDESGRAWLGTSQGLLSFEPHDVHAQERTARIRLHSVVLDGQELHPAGSALVLPADQRDFALRLEASLAPLHCETHFQYRVLPEEAWQDCGDRLAFSKLRAGTFALEARAAFGSGRWSEPLQVTLTLTPRPWERTPVRLALAAGLAALSTFVALWLHRWRLRHLARRAREATLLAQERARAAETLRLVMESVPAQLVSIGPERDLRWSNARFRQAWPQLGATARVSSWIESAGSAGHELEGLLERALRGENTQGSVTLALEQHLDVAFVPQRDPDGTLLGALGLLIDTTERRVLETRLHQAQRLEALGTFAGGIAHDFNNLLAVILGRTELALLELADPRATKEHLDEVLLSGMRARDLVARILTFGRRGTGSGEPCDVALATAETVRRMRGSLPERIRLQVELEPETWAGLDEIQVQQLVSNLASNAVLAMDSRGGTLEVRVARRPDGDVELRVRDEGCGMPPEVLTRAFEPFFSTRAIGSGTGLGLSVVHGIVRECGGSIEVESHPGQGTTFRVRLPAVTHTVREAQRTLTPATTPREPALTA